jgi:DNA-binding NarL/FixJ family response regulator
MKKRILLADDHKIVRDGMRALLEKQPDMEVVAETEDGLSTVETALRLKPDIVIMDITMPGLNGIEATRKIVQEAREIKVLALSMHSDKRFVQEMFKAGACGYCPKDSAFDEIASAIRAVMSNQVYLSPKVTDLIIKDFVTGEKSGGPSAFSVLSDREREVLQLIAEGKSTKQAAAILGIGEKTVETHRRQLMLKLDIHSVAELTKYALREGLTGI